jgi:hypothetical protein
MDDHDSATPGTLQANHDDIQETTPPVGTKAQEGGGAVDPQGGAKAGREEKLEPPQEL